MRGQQNNPIYFAEITDAQHLDIKEEAIPAWSRSILAKFADLDIEEIPSSDSQYFLVLVQIDSYVFQEIIAQNRSLELTRNTCLDGDHRESIC